MQLGENWLNLKDAFRALPQRGRTRTGAQLGKVATTMKVICVGFDIFLVMPQGPGTMGDLIRFPDKMVHSEGFLNVLQFYSVEKVIFQSFS